MMGSIPLYHYITTCKRAPSLFPFPSHSPLPCMHPLVPSHMHMNPLTHPEPVVVHADKEGDAQGHREPRQDGHEVGQDVPFLFWTVLGE